RLVHDEDVGIVDQRLREAGAVAIALRQRVDRLVEHRVEKAQLYHALHGFPARLASEPAQLGGEIEKALHRHVGIGGGVLGQVADQALRLERRFDDVVAADRDPAGGGRHESRDHAHGGRLSRAVRAEEAEHFAALDGERNVVYRPPRAEGLRQPVDFYHAKRGAELSPNYNTQSLRIIVPDVIVIGAGAAGLAAADELAHAGRSVLVVEARSRIGGRCWTCRFPGLSAPVELGAEFIHGRPPVTLALLQRAGSAVSSPRRLQRIARFAGGQRRAAAKRGARDTLGTRLGRSARRVPRYAVPPSRPASHRQPAAGRAAIGRSPLYPRVEGKAARAEEARLR